MRWICTGHFKSQGKVQERIASTEVSNFAGQTVQDDVYSTCEPCQMLTIIANDPINGNSITYGWTLAGQWTVLDWQGCCALLCDTQNLESLNNPMIRGRCHRGSITGTYYHACKRETTNLT